MSYRSKQASISHFFKSAKKENSALNGKTSPNATSGNTKEAQKPNATISKFSFNSTNNKENDPILSKSDSGVSEKTTAKKPIQSKRKPDLQIQSKVTKKRTTTLTPLEKQILELKADHPDKLLVIQVGYKYKLFGKDAKIGAQILNIMYIKGGDDGNKEEFSYCSFPDFKLHINLKRLLIHGHKIGVVKQMESAIVKSVEKTSKSSDLMKREITGVYTNGTYMGDEYVNSSSSIIGEQENPFYIICINEISEKQFAMVAVQPLTGDIVYDTFTDGFNRDEMETRLLYLNPSEVLVISSGDNASNETLKTLRLVNNNVAIMFRKKKNSSDVLNELAEYFDSADGEKYGHLTDYYSANFSKDIQSCFNELIQYLTEFKLSNVFTIPTNINTFTNARKYMVLPNNTLQALEIFRNYTDPSSERGTLIWLLQHTRTRFGKRLLNKWISKPLIEKDKIAERSQAIEDLTGEFSSVIDSLKSQLDKIGRSLDLEELLIKTHYSASYSSEKISRRDVFLMLNCFNDILKISKQFEKSIKELKDTKKSPLLQSIFEDLLDMSNTSVVSDLLNKINSSYLMNESKDLDEQKIQFFDLNFHDWEGIGSQMEEIKNIELSLDQELEVIKKILKRPQLKYITNNKEPYLIEVRNGKQVDELPPNFQRINGTTTVSRFRTEEISQLLKKKQYNEEILLKNCDRAFNLFLREIDEEYNFFSRIVKVISTFDCLLSLAAASLTTATCKPQLSDRQMIEVKNGRNPIIENLGHSKNYVSNHVNIHYDENRVLIITGPNMGGKSSYVKQVALLVIMTQIGCFVPCESATLGVFDSIFIRMGASDNILKGNSTFMTEMVECSNIIEGISGRSLVILDEIGRGTGTSDGIALAYSILHYLIESPLKPLVLFITHYPSLHVLEDLFPVTVANYHMGFQQVQKKDQTFPEVIFLYNLVKGVVQNSYGLNVAKLAGIPSSIISEAYKVSESLKARIEIENMQKFATEFTKVIQKVRKPEHGDPENQLLQKLEDLLKYI
ncbi:DNA mismatch repair protein MSH3 [Scheffersomyces xylosifermentans]|uniref:DNA mismatch repair protein MSH3 n=1 Tax=Scheffersomyces xylosifermentans TaxID=1304137 RepID=UPI00315D3CC8